MNYLNIAFALLLLSWGGWTIGITVLNAYRNPGRNRQVQFFMGVTTIALASLLLR
ncbi:hypothetical protein [Reyranella sp.]|uniref:hypothetical protein n=1 Tax=Reyranella sp. TaxID=1929291 RepID=UPI0025DE3A0C|nr:hypothetical protein [Reyranella sp.]